MRLHFRPLPVFTLASVLALALLVSLGTWQVQRLHWKLGLIAQVNRNLTLPPLSLDRALAMGPDAQYRRVALVGHFEHDKEAFVYGIAGGVPAWFVVTPFMLQDGRILLVDRGIVPDALRDPHLRREGQVEGIQQIVGVWRTPDAPGTFTPKPEPAKRNWFSRDVASIAAANHVTLAAPVMVEADATPNPGGWPKGGQTQVTFRNEHLSYAVTWYGLALTLIGVYIAFHIQKGRLEIK